MAASKAPTIIQTAVVLGGAVAGGYVGYELRNWLLRKDEDDMNQRVREEVQRRRQAAELVDEPTTIIRAATAPQDAKPSR